jgi:hypothetical protein
MVLNFYGEKTTEDELLDYHYVNLDERGSTWQDYFKWILKYNEKEGRNYHSMYFKDSYLEDILMEGELIGNKIILFEEIKGKYRSARELIPKLKSRIEEIAEELGVRIASTTEEVLAPASFLRRGEGVGKVILNGEVGGKLFNYLKSLDEIQSYLKHKNLEIIYGELSVKDSIFFLKKGIPVIFTEIHGWQPHALLLIGYEEGWPIIHDPLGGKYINRPRGYDICNPSYTFEGLIISPKKVSVRQLYISKYVSKLSRSLLKLKKLLRLSL